MDAGGIFASNAEKIILARIEMSITRKNSLDTRSTIGQPILMNHNEIKSRTSAINECLEKCKAFTAELEDKYNRLWDAGRLEAAMSQKPALTAIREIEHRIVSLLNNP